VTPPTPPPERQQLGPTYRLQLTPSFGFAPACEVVPHLAKLGVDFAYLSPVAEARPGSEHGYDGTDPTVVREELGGRAGFERLVEALHSAGIGVLLDIVPNHLSTWTGGRWWRDVLRHGRSSRYASVFDIDWDSPELAAEDAGTLILPILGDPLEEVLAHGELQFSKDDGEEAVLAYFDTDLPLAPGTAGDGAPVEEVLGRQHYRLQWWRDGRRNYRRFFTIDDLVGVRVEDPEVFELTHSLVAELVGDGAVDALRVDHVDGLADPEAYLRRLGALAGGRPVVVEKILTGDEPLRRAWPVCGTTGYEVAGEISTALVDAAGIEMLAAASARDGERAEEAAVAEGKRLVADASFASEVRRVARLLGLRQQAVAEAAVAMPVYRTYVSVRGADPLDEWLLEAAGGPELRKLAVERPRDAVLEGVLRFQQLTSAAMAKGVEDTAWYRLVGKLPFLEVGGDPAEVPAEEESAVARLHRRARIRVAHGERGLVPGTTHDTKRSADVRARLLALAELAPAFEAALERYTAVVPPAAVGDGRPPVPGPLDRRRIAETCIAMAPFPDEPRSAWDGVADRVEAALRKGAREAKVRDSWEDVNEAYEGALVAAARALLEEGGRVMGQCFGPVLHRVQRYGASLALSQVVLRSTVPGVPDCYQGDEGWNFTLVDPDNRRPVDFGRLSADLDALPLPGDFSPDVVAALRRSWRDGRVKLQVTRQSLHARRLAPGAFGAGADHLPLQVVDLPEGTEPSALAFARAGRETGVAIVVVTRAPHRLRSSPDDLPVGRLAWSEAALTLPDDIAGGAGEHWYDVLSGATLVAERRSRGTLPLAEVLATLPVAVLVPAERRGI
jgi:(1->4)-alpha-D-glucan 1-alpha-D-glucosylmutase